MNKVEIKLNPPSLEEAANAISTHASKDWGQLSVSVVECPDLRAAPFHLAAPGLGGRACVLDIGGPGHLFPRLRKDKIYDLRDVCNSVGFADGFVIGPGAAPHHKIGHNAEGIYNCCVSGQNLSCYTDIVKGAKGYATQPVPASTTEFALMANLLVSEGLPSKVQF